MISERAAIPPDDGASGGDVSKGFDPSAMKLVAAWVFLVWYTIVWIVCLIGYVQMFVLPSSPLAGSRSISDDPGIN